MLRAVLLCQVGEFTASGFLFKDTVEVNAIDDDEGAGAEAAVAAHARRRAGHVHTLPEWQYRGQ